jgi:hypothetical protein
MAARGGELALTWGRSLYRRLRAQGLVNVGMEGYLAIREGRTPGARLFEANFEQIRQEAISAWAELDSGSRSTLTIEQQGATCQIIQSNQPYQSR